jgi:hypothetical protein
MTGGRCRYWPRAGGYAHAVVVEAVMTRQVIVLSSLAVVTGQVAPRPALAQADTASNKATTSATASTSSSSDQSDILGRPKAPAVFLTGGYGLGVDRSSHFVTNQPGNIQTNLSGRTPWRSFGVGTFLTPRLSVRFEMTLPATLTVHASMSGPTIVENLTLAETTQTGAVLFGYHTSSTREVSLEYLGGVLFVSQRQHSIAQVSTNTGTPLVSPMVTDAYAYKSAAIAGADVNIALGRHLAVVPEFRAWSLGGTFSSRTSLGFRVSF